MGRQAHVHVAKALPPEAACYPSWLRPCGATSCTLSVHAKPGAKVRGVKACQPTADNEPPQKTLCAPPRREQTYGLCLGADTLDITIDAPAREGEANAAILEYLAWVLGLKKRAVALAAGAKSREKVVRVEGASAEAVLQRLREAASG